jgi:hypothetical protein
MNLHSDQGLFRDAIQATSQHIGIPEEYVEKDYLKMGNPIDLDSLGDGPRP